MSPPAARSGTGSASPPGYRAARHRDLAGLEPHWRRAERHGHATPFQCFAWVEELWRFVAEPAGIDVFFVTVAEGGEPPRVFLPLALTRRRDLRVISFIDCGLSDYHAPVFAAGFAVPPDRLRAFWAAIRSVLPPADLVDFRRMPPTVAGQPNPLAALPGARTMPVGRFGLPIAPPVGDLIQRVTRRSTFRDIGKFRRRIERQGSVRFEVAGSIARTDVLADTMVEQRRARFDQLGRDNLLAKPEVEEFYRFVARSGVKGGAARLCGLFVGAECIGTAFGFVQGDTFALVAQTMAGGEWQRCSPGILTTAAAIEWAAAQGFTTFDFTIGNLPYKMDLGATESPLFEYEEALSLHGLAFQGARVAARTAKRVWARRAAVLARARDLRERIVRRR